MRVRDLIVLLEEQDQDRIVVMAADDEGNDFRPVSSIGTGSWDKENFGIEELTEDLEEQGYTEDDIIDGQKAICLW